jgi:fatty acid-binding protein DegV
MNIIELKRLIKELKQNPKDNKELIVFYEGKEKELIKEINQKLHQKFKKMEFMEVAK